MADRARRDLLERVDGLLAEEAERFLRRLVARAPGEHDRERLAEALAAVRRAR